MSLSFRAKPRKSDVEKVRALAEATGVFTGEEVATAAELVADALAGEDYLFVFAEDGRKLLGYACYGPTPLSDVSYDLYWLINHPEAQGKGLAGQLIAESAKGMKDAGGWFLFAETSGTPPYEKARKCYLRYGFEEVARLKEFYRKDDDKVIYRLRT
jgi:ribosomal protein S18 acetylase RimI-like enzyme